MIAICISQSLRVHKRLNAIHLGWFLGQQVIVKTRDHDLCAA